MFKKFFTLVLLCFIVSCSFDKGEDDLLKDNWINIYENNLLNKDFKEDTNLDKTDFIINTKLWEK